MSKDNKTELFIYATEAPDTFSSNITLTASATANAAIAALSSIAPTPQVVSEIEIWKIVGNLNDQELNQEDIRLAVPTQRPSDRFGSAPREQVLRAIEIESRARKQKEDEERRKADDQKKERADAREFHRRIIVAALIAVFSWLLGRASGK